MIIYVDIDETICWSPPDRDYHKSIPLPQVIDTINQYYEEGHTIVYWTTRGLITGVNWQGFTRKQLKQWGCKFHKLKMRKPFYDLFIDDKAKRPEEIIK